MSLYAQGEPPPPYQPLDAVQLNQLVAPIALYPDTLVAQVLAASTYPQQVGEANNWMQQSGGMPPQQLAEAANGMQWDPSVKSLTMFPSVLDMMAHNYDWTASLGNAYYNQPGDVMNALQAMRWQARQNGALRDTPQMRYYDNGGLIVAEPMNPAVVYVPYYNPWAIYGPGIGVYRGWWAPPTPRGLAIGLGIGFAAGISIGLWAHYGWGYHAWSPNWRGGGVYYNHTSYISHSRTVVNYGHSGGYNRGVYEHSGAGVPSGFHAPVRAAYGHPAGGGYNRPGGTPYNRPSNAGMGRPAGAPHPGPSGAGHGEVTHGGSSAYNRPAPQGGHPQSQPAGHSPSGFQRSPNSTPTAHTNAGGMRTPPPSPRVAAPNPRGQFSSQHTPSPQGGGHSAPAPRAESHSAPHVESHSAPHAESGGHGGHEHH